MAQETEKTHVNNHALLAAYYGMRGNKDGIKTKIIQKLIKNGNINFQIPSKNPFRYSNAYLFNHTAAHIAIEIKDYENFKVLIDNGADYTIKNGNEETPVHLILKEFYGTTRRFIELRECLDSILSAHIKSQNYSNPRNKYGLSHFHAACIRSRRNLIKMFLKNGVTADEAVSKKSEVFPGYTPLHFAVRFSCVSIAKLLLNRGVDINCKDYRGRIPLDILIKRNIEIADWMNMGKRDRYGYLKVEYERNEKIIRMIIQKMELVDHQDTFQLTILHAACTLQDTSKLEMELRKENVNLNQPVTEKSAKWIGWTPLHFAVHFNVESVKLLLKAGANFLTRNARGFRPFDLFLQRYEVEDLRDVWELVPDWKNIKFKNIDISLSNALSAMKNKDTFSEFLKSLDNINMYIERKSPLFSGYSLLNLAIIFLERNQDKIDNRCFYDLTDDTSENFYNCSKEQEEIYLERIKICLDFGIAFATRTVNSPIDLAFRKHKDSAVKLLLEFYKGQDNFVRKDNLSHFHISCATGNKTVVENLLLKKTERINRAVTTCFKYHTIDNENRIDFDIVGGSTPLHIAVSSRNAELVKLLIDNNADVYVRDQHELTPIHQILVQGSKNRTTIDSRFEVIANELLMIEGLKECETSFGLSHLHVASFADNVTAIEKLLANGANINATISFENFKFNGELKLLKNLNGFTPLHLALKHDCQDAVVTLIQSNANLIPIPTGITYENHSKILARTLNDDWTSQENIKKFGLTKLHAACATLNVEQVQELLDAGADPNAQINKDSPIWPGYTALHFVVIERKEYPMDRIREIIVLLINRGADVTLKNLKNDTAIHRAMYLTCHSLSNFEFPPEFFNARTDFNIDLINNDGMSHFHAICYCGPIEMVEEFLKHGVVDVNQTIDFGSSCWPGQTPLHIAAKRKRGDIVDLLLNYGANVHKRDAAHTIPLHKAAVYYGNNHDDQTEEALLRLVKTDNDLHSSNLMDDTPLELLVYTKRSTTDTFRLFLKEKNRVNLFNSNGEGFMAMTVNNDEDLQEFSENTYFAAAIKALEANGPDEMGRTLIHNVVSLPLSFKTFTPIEVHTKALEQLIKVGVDIDQQDATGRTALHAAAQHQNDKGFTALLNLGADINITDNDNCQTPLFYISEWFEKDESNIKETQKQILKASLDQIHKMKYTGIYVSDSNITHEATLCKHLDKSNETAEENWQAEKDNLMNENIYSEKWKLWDFLFETGAVSWYPKMMPSERQAIDNFFQTNSTQLLQDYTHFGGLLMLQYRKAKARLDLIKIARTSLRHAFNYILPDVCCDCVIGYLCNNHLKKLIQK